MKGFDGKLIAPTNKKFHIEFCTVAHWKNSEIIEEKLFYDLTTHQEPRLWRPLAVFPDAAVHELGPVKEA